MNFFLFSLFFHLYYEKRSKRKMYERIHESWKPLFEKWASKIEEIMTTVDAFPGPIYPPRENIFRVFEMSVHDIQIVICGQDVYHQPGQANGLAFSVNKGIKIPPSLRNIYKELQDEYPERNYTYSHGDLSKWSNDQKIFLMNAALTVQESSPGVFMKYWEPFTDDVIRFIKSHNTQCLFLLWGNFAIGKKSIIEDNERTVECAHPSPLSASRGFFGSNCFKKIEEKLGKTIDWSIE